MIGIGIFPGSASGSPLTESGFVARAQSRFTTRLQGLWLPSGLVSSNGTTVDSWTASVGANLANRTVNRFGYGTWRDRPCTTMVTDEAKSLASDATGVGKHFWLVTEGHSTAGGTEVGIMAYNDSNKLTIYSNTSNVLWTSSFETHYINGVATDTMPTSGTITIETTYSYSASAGIEVAGFFSNAQTWSAPIGAVMQLSDVATAQERADQLQDFRRLFRY